VAASEEVCDILSQRSRPQLFSNALPPTVACSALRAIELMLDQPQLLTRLRENTRAFRELLRESGYAPLDGEAAIVPIIIGETSDAMALSARLLDEGVFVTGFGFPVVPEGTARVRVQMSAALEREHLDRAIAAFERVKPE
jgi:glycine C-acetyltransferase